ncbi:MAG: flagellar hook-associated protein FlgK [Lachnospiraceae bacterium]|nr:flagellar hook-associated protein FlgK [Lachnospiraceae bacterium]
MPLMGSLYIGTSGLQTSQNALNTTAHNLSNISTTGYVRQQVSMTDSLYNTISINMSSVSNKQLGMGVTYAATRQVRSYFLDQSYRKESGRSAFYETSSEALSEIEDLFGELEGVSFSSSLDNLWTAVQELAKSPADTVKQGLLVQRASEFVTNAQSVYGGLTSYQSNLNLQVKKQVETINSYGKKIKELNEKISNIESGGVERANDLRDARNLLLDKLGGMANISFEENANNVVSVSIEGEPFVTDDKVYEIALDYDETTGFYTPFWPQNATYTLNADGTKDYKIDGAKVFNLNQTISSTNDTDIGSLKALLYARGDHAATYEDLEDKEHYDKNISQSIVMNVEAEFDRLISTIATAINGVLKDASDRADDAAKAAAAANGATAAEIAATKSDYMKDSDGNAIQLFTTISGDKMTTNNLQINAELSEQPSKLGFVLDDKSEDQTTADALVALFQDSKYVLNPNVTKKNTFTEFYSDLVSQVGNSGTVYKGIQGSQEETVQEVDAARQQISGVAQDEELTNMIKFQNAYNASSRYINVISEMLEHIITTLGS